MPKSTPDFDEWLETEEPNSLIEVRDLLDVLDGGEDGEFYSTSRAANGALIVVGPAGNRLVLTTQRAEDAFRARVNAMNPHGELDIDSAISFEHALNNEHA